MHRNATTNEYQKVYPLFDKTPKAVIAATAFSLAMRLCEGNAEAAFKLLSEEWSSLYVAGIVPQKPRHEQHRAAKTKA